MDVRVGAQRHLEAQSEHFFSKKQGSFDDRLLNAQVIEI